MLYRAADFRCETCPEDVQQARGCPTRKREAVWRSALDPKIETRRCPLWDVSDAALDMAALYPDYQRGVLPVAGGLLDQSAAYIDSMRVVGDAIERMRAQDEAKQKVSAGRGLTSYAGSPGMFRAPGVRPRRRW